MPPLTLSTTEANKTGATPTRVAQFYGRSTSQGLAWRRTVLVVVWVGVVLLIVLLVPHGAKKRTVGERDAERRAEAELAANAAAGGIRV